MKYLAEDIKNNFIYQELMLIRRNPGLHLGKKSLLLLDCHIRAFIWGYMQGKSEEHLLGWHKEFDKYICEICVNGNECCGPANAIKKKGFDDETGLDYYYALLDTFLKERCIGEDFFEEHEQDASAGKKEDISYLGKEIKTIKFGKDQIREMACKYIHEHYREVFDLPERESMSRDCCIEFHSGRIRKDELVCAVYDCKYVEFEDVKKVIGACWKMEKDRNGFTMDRSLAEIWEIKDTDSFVIAMDEFISAKCNYGDFMEALSAPERVFFVTQTLEKEVNNGGFSQFFLNTSNQFAYEIVGAFISIGAKKTSRICERALEISDMERLHKDNAVNREVLSEEEEEKFVELFEECDEAFYEYEDELNELNRAYILRNREYFSE